MRSLLHYDKRYWGIKKDKTAQNWFVFRWATSSRTRTSVAAIFYASNYSKAINELRICEFLCASTEKPKPTDKMALWGGDGCGDNIHNISYVIFQPPHQIRLFQFNEKFRVQVMWVGGWEVIYFIRSKKMHSVWWFMGLSVNWLILLQLPRTPLLMRLALQFLSVDCMQRGWILNHS